MPEEKSKRGGRREGAGRPVGTKTVTEENALSVQVAVRLTACQKKELEKRAAQEGITVSKFIHKILFPDAL
ncbi:MAG: hypothetical protein J6V90_06740 [Treponema sp.]|nr:hypothetical protein [Treponema sp.]MBR5965684.1 hypothetical protein [Treponema sp.]